MNLPKLTGFSLEGKRVIVRADLDTEPDPTEKRLQILVPTIDHLLQRATRIILAGHKGRPEGKFVDAFSLEPLALVLPNLFREKVSFAKDLESIQSLDNKIVLLENLRFYKEEEANDESFTKRLANFSDFYINEAFGVSHRKHASIIGLPRFLPHAAGLHFFEEVETLSKVFENPKRPVIVIISGVKKDKLEYVGKFEGFADKILVGGRLPEFLEGEVSDPKVMVAKLIADKEDITIHSIEGFEEEIANAGTIVVVGPVGKFEDKGHRQGTERVFGAVARSTALKIAGGGDTEKALSLLGLSDRFDWVSVGGGATLEFLANYTLPGIQALLE